MTKTLWQHPLTNRYSNERLLTIWSDWNRHRLWVHYWIDLLLAQNETGMVSLTQQDKDTLSRLRQDSDEGDVIDQALLQDKEQETKHEVVAYLSCLCSQMPGPLARLLHLGATSSDPEDYAFQHCLASSIELVLSYTTELALELAQQIRSLSGVLVLGRTHLQPAEPTTLGYRLSPLGEVLASWLRLNEELPEVIPTKLQHGAVGTMGSLLACFGPLRDIATGYQLNLQNRLESFIVPPSQRLCVPKRTQATGQTISRLYEVRALMPLVELSAIVVKLAGDMRLMFSEPWFVKSQPDGVVGSSAMPGKVNPVEWETITSLARPLQANLGALIQTAQLSHLERTLDDSACRRLLLPETLMLLAAMLTRATKALKIFSNKVCPELALEQINDEWRAWLPARALAAMSLKDSPDWNPTRQQLHDLVSKPLRYTSMTAKAYLSELGLVQELADPYLGLTFANQQCLAVADSLEAASIFYGFRPEEAP